MFTLKWINENKFWRGYWEKGKTCGKRRARKLEGGIVKIPLKYVL